MQYSPIDDGVTHINVYSKGRTKLGRDLSNFAAIGIIHPSDSQWILDYLTELRGNDAIVS